MLRLPKDEHRSDQGAVAVLVAVFVTVLLIMVAIALDTGRWYVEASRVQTAADAAAMGGVTWLPDDYNGARTTALAIAQDNGFPDGTTTNCDLNNANPPAGTTCVYVAPGARASQLQVSVKSVIPNAFGRIFGNPTTPITRTAVADFQAPTLMGSPCNALGNEPASTPDPAAQPVGTVIPNETLGGYPTCQTSPGFWLRMAGPANSKSNGDRYATRACGATGTYNCAGGSTGNVYNASTGVGEYRPEGYFFIVRVEPGAVGQALTMQIYDPAYIDNGANCNATSITGTASMNPYVTSTAAENTAADRYGTLTTPSANWSSSNPNPFCNGDDTGSDSGTGEGYFTSYTLREPTLTFNPLNGLPVSGCTKQFGYKASGPTTNELTSTNGSYNAFLAMTYHQWVNLCTFIPESAGDYYLQVRTNVAKITVGTTTLVGSGNTSIVYPTDGGGNVSNPIANPVSSSLDQTRYGHNRFALRVATSPSGANSIGADVAVSGFERFPIFAQVPGGTQTFNLIQVPENALGKSFSFSFFDVSDFSGTATLKVVGPTGGAYASGLTGCTLSGVTTTTGNSPSTCTFKIRGGDNNGKLGVVNVPIPGDYACTDENAPNLGECWMRVEFTLPGGSSTPNEDTTWDASINGDPVRLIE